MPFPIVISKVFPVGLNVGTGYYVRINPPLRFNIRHMISTLLATDTSSTIKSEQSKFCTAKSFRNILKLFLSCARSQRRLCG